MTRVLIVRGHQVTPWELAPWAELPDRFEVSYLLTRSNRFSAPPRLRAVRAHALRDLLPRGLLGEFAAHALGDRYLPPIEGALAQAQIVHAEELSYWFAADVAARKRRHGFKLVQTAWETLPLLSTYRNRHARRNRERVLEQTDLFLPATERAAHALELEGVERERMVVCPPGIDHERFALAPPDPRPRQHTLLSLGRLEWEKGHHDALRALAALRRGIVGSGAELAGARLLIVGSGPEESRLRAYAAELGLGDAVEVRGAVPYEQMPEVLAGASALVLASQSSARGAFHPLGIPRAFWEEQFGMVFAEAMAAGLAIVASSNGAIPEVLADTQATLVPAGDWLGIARALAEGPLSRAPAERVSYPQELVRRYSTAAAAERLAEAYDRLLAT